jgi:UDP-galactopyranose mutase
MSRPPIVILGAGLTGLSAAYYLERRGHDDCVVLESEDRVGGLTRTEHYDGFSFDHSIHILYTRHESVAALIHDLLGDNLGKQTRLSFCYTAGCYTEYPYQAYNHGLPAEIVAENILGLIRAHEPHANGTPAHYEDWILRTFGQGIAHNFMLPYNRKQWAWDLTDMSFGWIADRVPVPNLRDVLLGALRPPTARVGPNHEFWYPQTNGIEALPKSLAAQLAPDRVRLGSRVNQIDPSRREVVMDSGQRLAYSALISTLPLRQLIPMLGDEVPPEIGDAACGLKHNTVHTVNIGLTGTGFGYGGAMHWVYYPGDASVFHRVSFPQRFAASMAPQGCASVQAEISESPHKPISRATLVEDTLAGLVRVGLLDEQEVLPVAQGGRVTVAQIVTLDPAYVIYDHRHRSHLDAIRGYLTAMDIQTCGRFGDWEYFNMDESILAGKRAADALC